MLVYILFVSLREIPYFDKAGTFVVLARFASTPTSLLRPESAAGCSEGSAAGREPERSKEQIGSMHV